MPQLPEETFLTTLSTFVKVLVVIFLCRTFMLVVGFEYLYIPVLDPFLDMIISFVERFFFFLADVIPQLNPF